MHTRRPALIFAVASLIVLTGWAPTAIADEVVCDAQGCKIVLKKDATPGSTWAAAPPPANAASAAAGSPSDPGGSSNSGSGGGSSGGGPRVPTCGSAAADAASAASAAAAGAYGTGGFALCAPPAPARAATPAGAPAAAAAAPPAVTPGQVAQMAVAQLTLDAPAISMAPRQGTQTYVGLPTWFWAWDGRVPTRSATASLDGITVTAQATIDRFTLRFNDREHGVASCAGVGTVFVVAPQVRPSPTCGYVFAHPGDYTVTAEAHWGIAWNGAISGATAMVRTATAPIHVGEIQVLVTG